MSQRYQYESRQIAHGWLAAAQRRSVSHEDAVNLLVQPGDRSNVGTTANCAELYVRTPAIGRLQEQTGGRVFLANGELLEPLPMGKTREPLEAGVRRSGDRPPAKLLDPGTPAAREIEGDVPLWTEFTLKNQAPAGSYYRETTDALVGRTGEPGRQHGGGLARAAERWVALRTPTLRCVLSPATWRRNARGKRWSRGCRVGDSQPGSTAVYWRPTRPVSKEPRWPASIPGGP
jgi:hypothetical protein